MAMAQQRKPASSGGRVADRQAAKPAKSALREYAEALVLALVLAIGIRTTLVQAYEIPSGSMEPTLLVGDHLIADKLAYGLRTPDSIFGLHIPGIPYGRYLFRLGAVHRGDVIIFVSPPDPSVDLIKRVIAVGGDTVQIRDGHVWLNGAPMADPHAHFTVADSSRVANSPRDYLGPMKVPPGMLFVMGDNRDDSYDSRFWGFVPLANVEARAMFIYWPWDSDGDRAIPLRWSRFGMIVR
jgi:signal peptidase I